MNNPFSISKLARLFSITNAEKIVSMDTNGNPVIHSSLWATPQRPHYTNDTVLTGGSTFTFNPILHGQVVLINTSGVGLITFGTPINIIEGTSYTMLIKAGDTSARTFAWNAAFKFGGASSALSTATVVSGAIDSINWIGGAANTLIYNGHRGDIR